MEMKQATSPSQEAVDSVTKLYNAIYAAFPQAVTHFNSRWDTAHVVGSSLASANDTSFLQTDEFNVLKRLGPKIIPFVVFKLVADTTQNLWGVFLCESVLSMCRFVRCPPTTQVDQCAG